MSKVISIESSALPAKKLIRMNGKYYVEMEPGNGNLVEDLAISLASEVDMLREKIKQLEDKLRILQQ